MKEFRWCTHEASVDEGGPTLLRQDHFTRIPDKHVESTLTFLREGKWIFIEGGPETENPLAPERLLTREELQARALKCKRDKIKCYFDAEAQEYDSEFSEYGAPYVEERLALEEQQGNICIEEWHLIHSMPRKITVFPETLGVYGGFGDYLVCSPYANYRWTYDRVNRETNEVVIELTEEGEYFIAVPQEYLGFLSVYGFESPFRRDAEESHVRILEVWGKYKEFQAFHRTTGIIRKVSIPRSEAHGWWFKLLETDDGKASEEEWQQKVRNHACDTSNNQQ